MEKSEVIPIEEIPFDVLIQKNNDLCRVTTEALLTAFIPLLFVVQLLRLMRIY